MEKRKPYFLPKHSNTVQSRKRYVWRQESLNCTPQATESAKIKSDPNTSLFWELLFRVQFPFHWLAALFFTYSQGTIVRKHLSTWGRGREAENWRQGWREKFKPKFLATGRAKKRGNYCFSLTCVEMDPVAVGGPKFPSVLQKTVISGIRQNDCLMNGCYMITCNCSGLQSLSYSPQYYDPQMLSPPWTLAWRIPNSYFTSPRGSVSSLALIRACI